MKLNPDEIRALTRKFGMQPDPAPSLAARRSGPHLKTIIRLAKEGWQQIAIARQIGISQKAVHHALHKHGTYLYVTHNEAKAIRAALSGSIQNPKSKI